MNVELMQSGRHHLQNKASRGRDAVKRGDDFFKAIKRFVNMHAMQVHLHMSMLADWVYKSKASMPDTC